MVGHRELFRRRGIVAAWSLGVMATCKFVEYAGNFGDNSMISAVGELAAVPTVWAAGTAAMLGAACLAEFNQNLDEQQGITTPGQ
ncbi:MAG: hypothetical protein WAS36_01615 [Candidatus Saccharimonadales bacterium]